MTKKNKMLPSGFGDLLFEEAREDYYIKNILASHFMKNGFNIIKTPLLEFRDNFTPEQVSSSFSTIDVVSGKSLVLRNDITLQIERLLQTRLKDVSLPLKICYEGDVFLTKNDELYSDRQMTQSGFEIIGCGSDDYLQVIETSMELVSKLIDRKLILELSIPNLCSMISSFDDDLKEAIKQKKTTDIKRLAGDEIGNLICGLVTNFTDLDYVAKKISMITGSKDVADSLARLFLVRNLIESDYSGIEICYDVFGDQGDSYHQDIAFKVFCEGYSYPLLKGGKYQTCDLDSVGSTFYVNHIRKL